jgi:MFS family permease
MPLLRNVKIRFNLISFGSMSSWFSKESIQVGHDYNRWLIPPAALAIHLCIGQVYAFSVFNEPMTRLMGISQSLDSDWTIPSLGWIFSIALVVLGASAAVFGKWVERVGPRVAMTAAAFCFSGGFMVSALGVYLHQLWLLYLGYGVLGGIGLGLGYISPVSTLMKWFPDRPGMATGMAIMGFGGGAMIASPLSVALMNWLSSPSDVGVAPTFIILGGIYFVMMLFGANIVRLPPENFRVGASEVQNKTSRLIHVSADDAIRSSVFWKLFLVLMLNVTAGIGVLGQASLMIQEMFSGENGKVISASSAAGFVGLLSIFNLAGRFFWSSLSDKIGRKNTYSVFFLLGAMLYFMVPLTGEFGSIALFILCFALIISMYGGGFATIPAYLRDHFGTFQVGAIHGRLLLSWSMAAILGPVLVNYMRDYQLNELGMAASSVYSVTMYIMGIILIVGFGVNLSIPKPRP